MVKIDRQNEKHVFLFWLQKQAPKRTNLLCNLAALTFVLFIPETTYAQETMAMPGMSGLGTVKNWVTGPLPTTAGIISIAVGMLMLSNNENGSAFKWGLRTLIGIGGAIAAPNLVTLAGDVISGALF